MLSSENKELNPESQEATKGSASQDVIRTGQDQYGDEADAGTLKKASRSRKQKKPVQKKKKTPEKKEKSSDRLDRTIEDVKHLFKSTKPFEIVHTTHPEESNRPNGIYVFGRRLTFPLLIALILLFVLVISVFYNSGNLTLQQQTITAVGLADGLEGYRILVLSDLNGKRFGDRQSALLRTISQANYDIVICLGDMIGPGGDPEPFFELLEGLPSSKQVYFICGDSDPGPYVDKPRSDTSILSNMVLADWILGAMERNAIYVDRPMYISVNGSRIWLDPSDLLNIDATASLTTWKEQKEQEEQGTLSGLDADYDSLPLTTYRYRIAQRMYETIDSMNDTDFYIVLAHQVPAEEAVLSSSRHSVEEGKFIKEPELILAGHFCGGVFKLPFVGAIYIPDDSLPRHGWFPSQEKVGGLSSIGRTQVFITEGLSVNSKTPLLFVRLNNAPQVSVVTLTATLPENMLSAE